MDEKCEGSQLEIQIASNIYGGLMMNGCLRKCLYLLVQQSRKRRDCEFFDLNSDEKLFAHEKVNSMGMVTFEASALLAEGSKLSRSVDVPSLPNSTLVASSSLRRNLCRKVKDRADWLLYWHSGGPRWATETTHDGAIDCECSFKVGSYGTHHLGGSIVVLHYS